jgi:hypothetical protein
MRDIAENCDRQHAPVSASDWREAAAALDAEAARREAPHAELRGWGVMRPDGCLMADRPLPEDLARMNADFHNRHQPNEGTFRAVPVRLIAEEASDAK